MIAAVVLAAGRSQRMGRPKLALPWGATTVIGQVVEVLRLAGLEQIIVVTGGAHQEVVAALQSQPVYIVFNPDYASGEMIRSLQVGLAACDERVEAALVVLGDQPQIEATVVRSVMAAHEQEARPLVAPSYQMRRGHPWLAARPLWGALLALRPPATLRDFLEEQAGSVWYVQVDTPTILQDLDTPEDYLHFRPG